MFILCYVSMSLVSFQQNPFFLRQFIILSLLFDILFLSSMYFMILIKSHFLSWCFCLFAWFLHFQLKVEFFFSYSQVPVGKYLMQFEMLCYGFLLLYYYFSWREAWFTRWKFLILIFITFCSQFSFYFSIFFLCLFCILLVFWILNILYFEYFLYLYIFRPGLWVWSDLWDC